MASPFRFFRKHQKGFMAAAVVLCMVIFVFASALDPSASPSSGGRSDSAVVATWEGGSIREGELRNLVVYRRIVNEFLQRLWAEGIRSLGYEERPQVPAFVFDSRNMTQEDLEQRVIYTQLAVELAEDLGMSVSDAVVNNYLREWGLRQVDGQGIRAILGTVGRGDVAQNEAIVFDTLRRMLLAHYYEAAIFDASATVTPLQRWNDWLALNEKVSVQAVILPVADFVEEVNEPTEAQLKTLYEEYKSQPPNRYVNVELRELLSSEPGFAEPVKVRLQYLRGSVADWAERLRDTVTDEEIVDYYETNKETMFVETGDVESEIDIDFDELDQLNRGPGDDAGADAADDAEPADGDTAAGDVSDDVDAETTPSEDAGSELAGDGDSGTGEGAEGPVEDAPAEFEAEQGGESADTDATDNADVGDDVDETSQLGRRTPFRLANFQQEASDDAADPDDSSAEDAAGDSANSTAEAENGPDADEGDSAGDGAVEPSVDQSGVASTTGDESAAGAVTEDETMTDDAAAEQPTDQEASDDSEATEEATSEETVTYTPLDEVRETIRDRIAEDKAFEALPQRMNEALIDLQSAYTDYANDILDAEEAGQPPPEPPASLTDLDPYAQRYDLLVENTGLFTHRQLRLETLVGRAYDAQTSQRYVADVMVNNAMSKYEPFLARDLSGDWYLVQKTEVSEFHVPEFSKVRSEVAEAWKLREAAKLAEARAKQLAAELERSSQSFNEFFGGKDYEIVEQTEMFSRKTLGLVGGGANQWPMLSSATGLNNVGPDLLDAVFELKDGEAAGALNYDHTEAYVLQIRSRQMTDEELKELFIATSRNWQGRPQTTELHRLQFEQARLRQLQERVNLDLSQWQQSREEQLRERG